MLLEERAAADDEEEEEEAVAEAEKEDDGDWVRPTFSLKSLSNVPHFIVFPFDPWNMHLLSHPPHQIQAPLEGSDPAKNLPVPL